MLALVHRTLQHTKQEQAVLEQFIALEADAVYPCLRIIELGTSQEDWELVERCARHAIAVNPLLPQPYRGLTQAAEKTGKTEEAIDAYRALLAIGPADPAETHYRLALLLQQQNDPKAKRHVLSALEQAPRFRAAHKLLLEINRKGNSLATKEKKRE